MANDCDSECDYISRIVDIDVEFQVQLIFRSGVVMGTPILPRFFSVS